MRSAYPAGAKRVMNYPSKPFALWAAIEWGLCGVKITSPSSFSATSNGRQLHFQIFIKNHRKAFVDLGVDSVDDGFVLLLIPNKSGDNFVVIKSEDLASLNLRNLSFEELAKVIKRKRRFEYAW